MSWRALLMGYAALALAAAIAGFASTDRVNASSCRVAICGFERPSR
jgi:hypothetical protein